jgi:uncharacterized protein with GYD domain
MECVRPKERNHGYVYLAHELHRSRNGEYDVVVIVEAPDDISMTALGLSSGALGNVRGG